MPRRNWSYEETLMALLLYLCPPNRRKNWDDTDPEIRALARALNRTEGSVSLKIGNLKSCDPNRTGVGFKNASHMDRRVMEKYLSEPDATIAVATACLLDNGIEVGFDGTQARITVQDGASRSRPAANHPRVGHRLEGRERLVEASERINQGYFRQILMANYQGTCCLTGIHIPALLTASHIKPWRSASGKERLMASNGLLLNAFHDRAFDRGLITLNDSYRIVISTKVPHTPENDRWIYAFEGKRIHLPNQLEKTALPSLDFIHYHNNCIFEH